MRSNGPPYTALNYTIPFISSIEPLINAPRSKKSISWAWIELVSCCAASDERTYHAAKQPVQPPQKAPKFSFKYHKTLASHRNPKERVLGLSARGVGREGCGEGCGDAVI
jgi:hypothetical protein